MRAMRLAKSKRCAQLQELQLDLARRLLTAAPIGQIPGFLCCLGVFFTFLFVVLPASGCFLESRRVGFLEEHLRAIRACSLC